MAKKLHSSVYWSNRSISDSLAIRKYLQRDFSQKEIDNFYKLLELFEKIVVNFPKLYPESSINRNVRRAVLSKQLSVFYTISEEYIKVVAVLDNRVSYSKWP
jgi:plasmid stabilization system protein ParE